MLDLLQNFFEQHKENGYSLFVAAGPLSGKVFLLEPEKEYGLGRGSDQDLCFRDVRVSRRHARFLVRGNKLFVQDLNSANGTLLNQARIQSAELKEGDILVIGVNALRVITPKTNLNQLTSMHSTHASHDEDDSMATQASSLISGKLEDVPLPNLLQLFAASKKSGVLEIQSDADTASLYLSDGDILDVQVQGKADMNPEKAILRFLGWTEGQFGWRQHKPGEDTFQKRFPKESLQRFLMNAYYEKSEIEKLRERLPAPEAELRLSSTATGAHQSLSVQQLELVELLKKPRSMKQLLDLSPSTDLQTCDDLLYLLEHKVVEATPGAKSAQAPGAAPIF